MINKEEAIDDNNKPGKAGGIMCEAEEEAWMRPNGENAESGPEATEPYSLSSGFGGLGLEGMVGMDEPEGEGKSPPGEGKRGAMSGDSNSWKGSEQETRDVVVRIIKVIISDRWRWRWRKVSEAIFGVMNYKFIMMIYEDR